MSVRITVVGTGHVGSVVGGCLAMIGHQVVGLEVDRAKLEHLQRGTAPFFEPGADELLRDASATGRLRFTDDFDDAVHASDVVFLCVGTPTTANGHADTTALEAAARAVAEAMDGPKVLVSKSTVPIGSGHWLETIVEDALPPDRRDIRFAVASNPEFLRQGSSIADYLYPDRVVLGSDDVRALSVLQEIYRPILDQSFPGGVPARRPALVCTNLATAETIKYASNAFLALKVSFANEIANLCEHVGADSLDVARALGLDRRIGPDFLNAGAGWGGSCFGKDLGELIAVAGDHGYNAPLLRAARDVNIIQRGLVVRKLRQSLHGLRGRRIGLLGLAFKPGTDDVRDAPALDVARALVDAGARVIAHDPVVGTLPDVPCVRVVDDPYGVAERADAVVLMTEWPEYRSLELDVLASRMRGMLFVDGRNVFDPEKAEIAGLLYEGIGRSRSARAR
ncbi:MAG TPA: UDP-glucose/GDP-mannose dehydrogenase family protein [Acidimicrobiia bacterium]|nr:UDP-glucose/GDP-mannose dehydrogenase family protein [Acidimicrobiia bacterium]